MKLFIFCVRDNGSEQYGNPMFLISPGQALRSFVDEINTQREGNIMYNHPDDFDLYSLGMFDTNNGEFENLATSKLAMGKMVKVRDSSPTPNPLRKVQ